MQGHRRRSLADGVPLSEICCPVRHSVLTVTNCDMSPRFDEQEHFAVFQLTS